MERRVRNGVMDVWFWIFAFAIVGLACLWYSRHQPFPEISGRFSLAKAVSAVPLVLSSQI